MKEKYSDVDLLDRLYFSIESAESVFQKYDVYSIGDEGKVIYAKCFEKYPHFLIRIVTEKVLDQIEIKSIHFQKTKKPPT
jgi:hypothetical protein